MPETTPYLKVQSTKELWWKYSVIMAHVTMMPSLEAKRIEEEEGKVFIPPFDDIDIIYGQGTIALEILEDITMNVDYIVCSNRWRWP